MQCIFIKAIQNRNTSTENVSYHRFTEFDDTDFESNLGMWTNAYDDKLNWQRHSGYTQTLNTGPSSDHTLGKYKPLLSKRSRLSVKTKKRAGGRVAVVVSNGEAIFRALFALLHWPKAKRRLDKNNKGGTASVN